MRLLLVEDDTGQRRTISGLLGREGFEVTSCASLNEGVCWLQRERFPICVLDLRLNEQHGIELLRQLGESQARQTYFVIYTGHGTFESARDALNIGAFAFLEKLADPSELITCVHRAAAEQMRRSLSQAEEDIRLQLRLLDCVQQAVIATDLPGHVIFWNKFAETLYGWTAAEALGRNIFDLVVPVQGQGEAEDILELLRSGQVWRGEFVVQHRDGRCFPIEVTNSPIFSNNDQTVGIVGISGDITERKQAESNLRESEEKLRSVLDTATDYILSIDLDGVIRYINRVGEGQKRENIVGKKYLDFVAPDEQEDFKRAMVDVVATGQPVAFQTRFEPPDGMTRWFSRRMGPIVDEDRIVGFTVCSSDITGRINAENALRQRETELAHVGRVNAMGEVAGALAHEINQPLGAIANYAGRCATMLEAEKMKPMDLSAILREIEAEVHRASGIISRLRSFVSKATPRKSSVNVNELVIETDKLLRDKGGAIMRFELDQSLPSIQADPVQIQQVLVNLIQNAVEAMANEVSRDREIVVRTRMEGEAVGIEVTNPGDRLTDDQCVNIFEPYLTTKQEGMGLGLSISRTIVENHKGKIWATSNPSQGTTVAFTLPVGQCSAPQMARVQV